MPLFEQSVLQRNALGKILRKEELLDGEKSFYTYAYDAKGRLIDALHQGENGQLILHESYAYDANGNRNEASYETANSKQIRHVGYYQDGGRSDKIATYNGKPYVYDTNGNLRQKGSMQLRYGSLGELLSVTLENGDVITYKYNALNQRVAKYRNNQLVERYLWKDLTTLLAIYVGDASNYQILRFGYTDERVLYKMVYNQNTYHLIYDTTGSLRRIVDDAGTIIGEITYDSFGNVQSSKMPLESAFLGFASGLYDPDTKLTRFGYRDYDAETGKWTAKDPIGFAGGDTNLYGYVLGDPVNFVDPTGQFIFLPYLIGAGIGLGFEIYNQISQNGYHGMGNLNLGRLLVATGTGAMGGLAGLGLKGLAQGAGLGAISGGLNNGYQQLDSYGNKCRKFDTDEFLSSIAWGAGGGFLGSGGQNIGAGLQKSGGYGNINNIRFPSLNTYHSAGNYANHGAAIGGAIGTGIGNIYGN